MNSIRRSSAALGILVVLCTGGCTGACVTAQIFIDDTTEAYAPTRVGQSSPVESSPMGSYPNYSCSATDCSLAAVASSTAYPTTMLAVAKTTTIISLSGDPVADDDDPATGGVAPAPIGEQ